MIDRPKWTVVTNIVSPESDRWVGTSWEFFDDEQEASQCQKRHIHNGNRPTKRPYYEAHDFQYFGAFHRQ